MFYEIIYEVIAERVVIRMLENITCNLSDAICTSLIDNSTNQSWRPKRISEYFAMRKLETHRNGKLIVSHLYIDFVPYLKEYNSLYIIEENQKHVYIPQKKLKRYYKEIEKYLRESMESQDSLFKVYGFAAYIKRNSNLSLAVKSIIPSLAKKDEKVWLDLVITTYGKLNENELESLMMEINGQLIDGWGEGFEQFPIEVKDGELYLSFHNDCQIRSHYWTPPDFKQKHGAILERKRGESDNEKTE